MAEKIPLFILAGIDQNDDFGRMRIFELKFRGRGILEYLIDEAKKSDCFSEIFLVGDRKLKEQIHLTCFFTPLEIKSPRFWRKYHTSRNSESDLDAPHEFLTGFIEAEKSLWKNIKIVHDFVKNKYQDENIQIAVITSDILPSAVDFREFFSKCQPFLDNDIILLGTPSEKTIKKRGKHFVKKNKDAPTLPYCGTGGLYILRPLHLREKFIYFLASLRMPRRFRKIELIGNRLFVDASKSFLGLLTFVGKIIRIIINFIFFSKEILLGIKTIIYHQKRTLTFDELQMAVSKAFIKKECHHSKESFCHIEIFENPVFIQDIDNEEDYKLLSGLPR